MIRVYGRIKRFHKISNGWYYASLQKEKLDLDNPIGIGSTIPSIGKYLMSKGYWILKKIYRNNMKLIRIDTDAFHLIFYNVDIYSDIKKSLLQKKELIDKYGKKSVEVLDTYFLCDEFDLSTFPQNHQCYCPDQEGFFGKFKFEKAGNRIKGTYSVGDKAYIDDYENIGENKVLAGVKKEEKKNKISLKRFKECLLQKNFSKGYLAGPDMTSAYLRTYDHYKVKEIITKRSYIFYNDKVCIPSGFNPEKGYMICHSWGHITIEDEDLVELKEYNREIKEEISAIIS